MTTWLSSTSFQSFLISAVFQLYTLLMVSLYSYAIANIDSISFSDAYMLGFLRSSVDSYSRRALGFFMGQMLSEYG